MINRTKLTEVLVSYKKDFVSKRWESEKYKWEAVKWFQDNWDINASDFASMLEKSLDKTHTLLTSYRYFPKGMIFEFAKSYPEEVRAMFINLFDETKDVVERINAFKNQSDILFKRWLGNNSDKHHYQSENVISIYLWLRYPQKYYIFRYTVAKKVAKVLESDYEFAMGAHEKNIRNFLKLYDEVNVVIKEDSELIKLLQSQLTDACYPDSELRTLTTDVGVYIEKQYHLGISPKKPPINTWIGDDFDPGISTEKWADLLKDNKIFTTSALEIMKRMKDYGGEASCKQLSEKYGGTSNFYNIGSNNLAERVSKATNVKPPTREDGSPRWWTILYTGRKASEEEEGTFVWKLRSELSVALEKVDLTNIKLYAKDISSEQETEPQQEPQTEPPLEPSYWFLSTNPKSWSFSDMAVGEVQSYTPSNKTGDNLDAKTGDIVIGYESNPVKQIVAIGRVSAVQDGNKVSIEKVEGLVSPIDYEKLKECPELSGMEYFQNPRGNMIKLTKDQYDSIYDLIREENPLISNPQPEPYTKSDFLAEVYMTENKYNNLVNVLRSKKNIILQGAPGVGKTFTAKRLAWSMMEEKDDSRVQFVQFHQNYSYEDFVMGYKPVKDGFELKYGIFYRFCLNAANHPEKEYFFIIDEINRGNMSKIFGELLLLIEKDYRGTKATLAYNGLSFSVPKNLYIIGMMNTADRSLAIIDYALRRRFSFFEVEPGFDSDGFKQYKSSLNNPKLDELIKQVKELNKEIASDKSLGSGFCIGHSYFCGCDNNQCNDQWLQSIVDYDILPMLREYWFDNDDSYNEWQNKLHGALQ